MITMKKLSLKKQQVLALSQYEMANTNGGGVNRSNRRNGNCNYSDRNSIDVAYGCPGEPGGVSRVGCSACLSISKTN